MTRKNSHAVTEPILIVGATCTVGAEMVKQFAASGKRVKALVRSESEADGIRHLAEPVPYTPFVWNSIFQRGLLLEQVGILALTTDGQEGQKL